MPPAPWPRSASCMSGRRAPGWPAAIGPPPAAPRRDRHALRYGLLLSVLAALGVANLDAPARLYAAVVPPMPMAPGTPAIEVQAWITPPAYTRMAPVFLKPDSGTVSVPSGSHLTINVS